MSKLSRQLSALIFVMTLILTYACGQKQNQSPPKDEPKAPVVGQDEKDTLPDFMGKNCRLSGHGTGQPFGHQDWPPAHMQAYECILTGVINGRLQMVDGQLIFITFDKNDGFVYAESLREGREKDADGAYVIYGYTYTGGKWVFEKETHKQFKQ